MRRSREALSLLDRKSIPIGSFGYIGQYFCQECKGMDDETEWKQTCRGSFYYPPEYEPRCPHCGSDQHGENEEYHDMKVTRRFVWRRKHAA